MVENVVVRDVRDGIHAHARGHDAVGIRASDHSARDDVPVVVSQIEPVPSRCYAHGGEDARARAAATRKERGDVGGRHRAKRIPPHGRPLAPGAPHAVSQQL